jgi:hypothetical protein
MARLIPHHDEVDSGLMLRRGGTEPLQFDLGALDVVDATARHAGGLAQAPMRL